MNPGEVAKARLKVGKNRVEKKIYNSIKYVLSISVS